MALDELFAGLRMFNEGLQQYAVGSSLRDAQENMKQVTSQAKNDQERIQGLQAISDQLTRTWAGMGVNPAQISQAASSIAPPIKSSGDAFAQAQLTGSSYMSQVGKALQEQELVPQTRQQQHQERMLDKQLAARQAELGLKAASKTTKPQYMPPSVIEKLTLYDTELDRGRMLLKDVETKKDLVGPLVGRNPLRMFSPELATFDQTRNQWFDAYRNRITGAGASTIEIERLDKNLPSTTDTPEVFKRKLKTIIGIGETVRSRYIKRLTTTREQLLEQAGSTPNSAEPPPISQDVLDSLEE